MKILRFYGACGLALLFLLMGQRVGSQMKQETGAQAPVVRLQDIPIHRSPDGKSRVQLLLGPAVGVTPPAFHVGFLEFDPGASVPTHRHEKSDEILVVLAGQGVLTIEGRRYEVQAPGRVRILHGQAHAFIVTGNAPVKAVQIYAPPGPEHRFLAWPVASGETS